MVITIAGSSVGARDFTPNAILSLKDSVMMFHGMKLVPIRPAGLALVSNKPVIIVPGHAVSSTLTFFTLVLPILNHLSGLPPTSRRVILKAKVEGGEFSNERPIEALELVSLKKKEGADYVALPLGMGLEPDPDAFEGQWICASEARPKNHRVRRSGRAAFRGL